MRSTLLAVALGLSAWLFPVNPAVHAQGTGTSGEIRGTVTDPTGGTVPKATVEVEDAEKGIRRTAVTGSDGDYQVTGLPPSSYSVTVQVAGFQTETHRNVVVNVGQTLILDFHLRVAAGTAQIEVTSELPTVETARASQADTLVQQYIADLPIGRRDYLTFTLLAPGVSNSNTIADNADFRVKQTPQSGLSFYGSNGRGNSVTVDGGEANDDAGGVRLNLSQDAVQEFQINRSNYGAELGGASGATINIVSKSGTNDLHGSLFGFFRNDAMDARDPFAFTQALVPGQTFSLTAQGKPIKDSLNRQQFGGNVGFPLRKDKTFLYLAYEGLRSDAQDSVPLLTNSSIFAPTNTQKTIIANLAAQPVSNIVPCITTDTSNPLEYARDAARSHLCFRAAEHLDGKSQSRPESFCSASANFAKTGAGPLYCESVRGQWRVVPVPDPFERFFRASRSSVQRQQSGFSALQFRPSHRKGPGPPGTDSLFPRHFRTCLGQHFAGFVVPSIQRLDGKRSAHPMEHLSI